MSEDDDIDLYDDLSLVKPASATSKPIANTHYKTTSSQSSFVSLENQVKDLEREIKDLKEENETLKRNMGVLFRTAKREIQRKNAAMEALQQTIDTRADTIPCTSSTLVSGNR